MERKRKRRKLHNRVLKATAWFMFLALIISGCCADSPSWLPLIVCVIAYSWLALFAYANGYLEVKGGE